MNPMIQYQQKIDPYWSEIERFFGSLPPCLFEQVLLLKNNLTVTYGETGYLEDILSRSHDYPFLFFHLWLLDDLKFPNNKVKTQIERHVFLGMFYSLACTYIQQNMFCDNSFVDDRYVFLEQRLSQQVMFHFAQLFPEDDTFWEHYHVFWQDYAQASLWELQEKSKQTIPQDDDDLNKFSAKLATAKIPIVAVVLKSKQPLILPQLLDMIEHLSFIFQVRYDISTIRHDLFTGHFTYPIIKTIAMAGISPHNPIIPEQVLGAMVLTSSIRKVCQVCLKRLNQCRSIANDVKLPTWLTYFDVVESMIQEIINLFSLGSKISKSTEKQGIAFKPYINVLQKAIDMVDGYLLSDLTFQESWEVQRQGVFDIPEVVAKAFPAGFIIEVLCLNGHNLSSQVDEVFQTLYDNEFQYYDNFIIHPDTDDLGLLLRLYHYSSQKEFHCSILQKPLGWLEENILPSGKIPVYLRKSKKVTIIKEGVVWGDSGVSVEINILLGLIVYDWDKYQQIIEKSALNLFTQFIKNGLVGVSNYETFYTLWIAFKLVSQLLAHSTSKKLDDAINQVRSVLLEQTKQKIKHLYITPQKVAFLSLICLENRFESIFNPKWITVLLKNQRYDGSWDDEPFFITTNRGGLATWYSSRLMTTAFCYHALKTYAKSDLS